jgi:hypothetical protein
MTNRKAKKKIKQPTVTDKIRLMIRHLNFHQLTGLIYENLIATPIWYIRVPYPNLLNAPYIIDKYRICGLQYIVYDQSAKQCKRKNYYPRIGF